MLTGAYPRQVPATRCCRPLISVTPFFFFSYAVVFQVPIRVRDMQQVLQTPQFRDSIFWLVLSYRILDVPDVGGGDAEARERRLLHPLRFADVC